MDAGNRKLKTKFVQERQSAWTEFRQNHNVRSNSSCERLGKKQDFATKYACASVICIQKPFQRDAFVTFSIPTLVQSSELSVFVGWIKNKSCKYYSITKNSTLVNSCVDWRFIRRWRTSQLYWRRSSIFDCFQWYQGIENHRVKRSLL